MMAIFSDESFPYSPFNLVRRLNMLTNRTKASIALFQGSAFVFFSFKFLNSQIVQVKLECKSS